MPLPPWDSSIRVSQALNEEVNTLNCLLEMKCERADSAERARAPFTCALPCVSVFSVLFGSNVDAASPVGANSRLCSLNRRHTVP